MCRSKHTEKFDKSGRISWQTGFFLKLNIEFLASKTKKWKNLFFWIFHDQNTSGWNPVWGDFLLELSDFLICLLCGSDRSILSETYLNFFGPYNTSQPIKRIRLKLFTHSINFQQDWALKNYFKFLSQFDEFSESI